MEPRSPEDWWPIFQQAMRAGDVEAVLRLYEPGAVIANPAGQVRSGHVDLREELGLLADAKADFQVKIKKIRPVRRYRPDAHRV